MHTCRVYTCLCIFNLLSHFLWTLTSLMYASTCLPQSDPALFGGLLLPEAGRGVCQVWRLCGAVPLPQLLLRCRHPRRLRLHHGRGGPLLQELSGASARRLASEALVHVLHTNLGLKLTLTILGLHEPYYVHVQYSNTYGTCMYIHTCTYIL